METSSIVVRNYDPFYQGSLLKNFTSRGTNWLAESFRLVAYGLVEFQISLAASGNCKLKMELWAELIYTSSNGAKPLYTKSIQLLLNDSPLVDTPIDKVPKEYVWDIPASKLKAGDNKVSISLPITLYKVNGQTAADARVGFKSISVQSENGVL